MYLPYLIILIEYKLLTRFWGHRMTISTSSSLDDVIDHVNDVTIANRIYADRKIPEK